MCGMAMYAHVVATAELSKETPDSQKSSPMNTTRGAAGSAAGLTGTPLRTQGLGIYEHPSTQWSRQSAHTTAYEASGSSGTARQEGVAVSLV